MLKLGKGKTIGEYYTDNVEKDFIILSPFLDGSSSYVANIKYNN